MDGVFYNILILPCLRLSVQTVRRKRLIRMKISQINALLYSPQSANMKTRHRTRSTSIKNRIRETRQSGKAWLDYLGWSVSRKVRNVVLLINSYRLVGQTRRNSAYAWEQLGRTHQKRINSCLSTWECPLCDQSLNQLLRSSM